MSYNRRPRRVRLRSVAKLERAMRDRDVNASELAVLARMTRQNLSNIRNGRYERTSLTHARAIADALRVPCSDLFDLGDDDEDEAEAS